MKTIDQRNSSLDVMKCLSAFMVVLIHYNKVSGECGLLYSEIIRSIARSAVPFFFMVTGYYLPVIVDKGKLNRQISRVLILAIGSTAFYLLFNLISAGSFSSALDYMNTHYTKGTLFSWIVLNDDPAGYHLWYLYGLFYSLVFYAVLYRLKLHAFIPFLTFFMLLALFVANYTETVFTRNYLLGIPCIGCGVMVRKYKIEFGKKQVLLIFMSICFVVAEMLFARNRFGKSFDIYTFNVPLALCMLTGAINNPTIGKGTVWAVIGMKLSAYIYIFHVFVDNMIGRIIDYDSVFSQVSRPFVVFVSSVLFSYFYVKVKDMFHGA